jgi:hypothetical protein
MSTAVAIPAAPEIERVLIGGDLAKLTPEQRVIYYNQVCESIGLNPLTKPFQYLNLNGKTVLYATKDCTEQLRQIHNISLSIVSRESVDGIYVVTARAVRGDGRQDESIGAVPLPSGGGEARANAIMKGETKAKRRVTLSICGLGMLDESEIESIPDAKPAFSREAQQEVAQQRIAQLSAPAAAVDVPPAVVVELAESLDKPVEGFKSAAAVVDESMPDWAKKKEPKPKPAVSFEMLQAFGEVKKKLNEAYGSDAKYYEILGGFGYESSTQIPDRPTGQKIYKTLTGVLTAWKRDNADREEANELILKIDYPLLKEEVAAMSSEEVGRLLVVLREKAKETK